MKTLAIVGGSYAGVQTAISARDNGFDGRIVLLSAEKVLPYHRPTLSKGFLLNPTEASSLLLRAEAFFNSKNIELMLGQTVLDIDVEAKTLTTDVGTVLHFDDVVLATGASNRRLPWQQPDTKGVYSLRNLEDAEEIKVAMQTAKKAVVVGGGFIGLELAASFAQKGIATVLLERSDGLARRVFSSFLSGYVDQQHRQQGVDIRYESEVEALEFQANSVSAVKLKTGECIEADLVVVGVGATPNTHLLHTSGLAVEGGVVVDAHGRTALEHVYAVGDCAQLEITIDSQQTQRMRLESVHAANELGKAAGACVAGIFTPFTSAPWFWSDQYDLKIQMVGIALPTDQIVVRGNINEKKFSVFHLRPNGELGAVQSVNRPAEHMLGRRLVAAQLIIEPTLLEDESVNLKEWLTK